MSAKADLRKTRPIRYFFAKSVYRAIWWPVVALAVPFSLLAWLVDWLSWTAFPKIGRVVQPILGAVHEGALAVGNTVLGYPPKGQDQ